MYFQNSYYCSSDHVVSECRIAFGNIHFLGELNRLCTSTGIIITNLRFSFILSMKFFVSPHILTVVLGLFTNNSVGHVTMASHPKWRSTDWLFENIHFLSDYSISSRGVTEQSTLAERGEFHENSTPILRVDYSCIYNNL